MILAGDIGATKTILAIFDEQRLREPHAVETYPSREHESFRELLGAFVEEHRPRVDRACVGVAGPVKDNRSTTTNLPWVVDGAELAAELDLDRVRLINDLEAFAFGLELLDAEDLCDLNPGASAEAGNRAVIAAGTGLGEAGLYWDGRSHRPFATEGGHTSFAPRSELEMELLRFLLGDRDRISVERVVSGMGLEAIYRFFVETGRAEEPPELEAAMAEGDGGEVITRFARRGVELCERTLDLFVSLYGAEAGDLALKVMARGGVYVGGGIAPKILDELRDGAFLRAFTDKGRMRRLMEAMPVRVILNPRTGLMGAARAALEIALHDG